MLHILFSAIVSGYMDWTDCFLVSCFHFSFFHFLIYSLKTGLALLQYSQLKWDCDIDFYSIAILKFKQEMKLHEQKLFQQMLRKGDATGNFDT